MDVRMYWLLSFADQKTLLWTDSKDLPHDQTILWTDSKDLPHVFIHGSRRLGVADAKNQGPVGGIDHKISDLTTNVVLRPDAVLVTIADAITGTRTVSWAWGWSFSCLCQYKGEFCLSLMEQPRHRWLREMQVVHRRKSSPPGCPRNTLWGVDNGSQHPFMQWSSLGWCWGS